MVVQNCDACQQGTGVVFRSGQAGNPIERLAAAGVGLGCLVNPDFEIILCYFRCNCATVQRSAGGYVHCVHQNTRTPKNLRHAMCQVWPCMCSRMGACYYLVEGCNLLSLVTVFDVHSGIAQLLSTTSAKHAALLGCQTKNSTQSL
jgi:hypothetical protein